MTLPASPKSTTIDRAKAAKLLRAARNAHPDDALEAIEWALASLPDHRGARRLAVDQLQQLGDYKAADALIAASLLRLPDDWSMLLRRARGYFLQGMIDQAEEEVRRVLKIDSRCISALILASEIALRRGDRRRAVALVQKSVDEFPHNKLLRSRLIDVMLAAGIVDEAAKEIATLASPSPLLQARVCCAQERWLDAIEILEHAVSQSGDSAQRHLALEELIRISDQLGDETRLGKLCAQFLEGDDALRLEAAKALLGMGRFEQAAGIFRTLAAHPPHRCAALHGLVVAEALAGRHRPARAALWELNLTVNGNDSHTSAKLWLAGMMGRVVADVITTAGRAATKPPRLIDSLLGQAIEVFENTLHNADDISPTDADDLVHYVTTCRGALGHFPQSLPPTPASMTMELKPDQVLFRDLAGASVESAESEQQK